MNNVHQMVIKHEDPPSKNLYEASEQKKITFLVLKLVQNDRTGGSIKIFCQLISFKFTSQESKVLVFISTIYDVSVIFESIF